MFQINKSKCLKQKYSIAFLKFGYLDFEIACPVKWGFGNFWFDVLQSA